MRAGDREFVPTHSMLLELSEEHRSLAEGHDFLDQKRILLAGEILRRLAAYRELARSFDLAQATAREALGAALARHGPAELRAHPAPEPRVDAVERAPEAFLGVALVDLRFFAGPASAARPPVNPSPEARRAAERFRRVVEIAVELAASQTSIARLLADYRRTERRTRALEDVILPELGDALHAIESHLEEQELEEAVRARLAR